MQFIRVNTLWCIEIHGIAICENQILIPIKVQVNRLETAHSIMGYVGLVKGLHRKIAITVVAIEHDLFR